MAGASYIDINEPISRFQLRFVNGGNTYTLASLVANANDVFNGLVIDRIQWIGPWTISRGATLLVDFTSSTGAAASTFDFSDRGFGLTANNNTSIVVATTATSGATLIINGHKQQ